jgi:hypothetical protein
MFSSYLSDDPETTTADHGSLLAAYPASANAHTAIAVFRATPPSGLSHGCTWPLKMFERHSFTTQAFIPMAKGEWGGGVGEPAMERTEAREGCSLLLRSTVKVRPDSLF